MVSNCSKRHSYCSNSKKLGMASEPLLPLTDSDSERLEAESSKYIEDIPEKAAISACKGPHLLVTENGRSSPSAEYCFFCTQQGPLIKENVSNDQKSRKKTKSQSMLVLNSFCSKGTNTSQSLADLCDNLTPVRCSSASVLNSATLKVKQPSRNSSKAPSICSSLSKLTELQESCGLMCRICHSGSEDEELIRPCKCTGTVKYAHQSCILNWVSKSGHENCELCKFKFRTRKQSVKCFWKVCCDSLFIFFKVYIIKDCVKASSEPFSL